jgi:fructose-bisphosphate aldolase, class I
MVIADMRARMREGAGFIAALDQSGGSTPGALRQYGIPDTAYTGEEEMYRLIHEMRVRIMSAPAFTGNRVIGAILFERTMDGQAHGKPVPSYLWNDRNVVPFLKVDKGLEAEKDGVALMKPIPGLDALLERAVKLGIFGTKMRSTIQLASKSGIAANVAQQFELGRQIAKHGLVPILEPEVDIKSPQKAEAEAILLDELLKGADAWPAGTPFMVKVTIPTVPDHYAKLIAHERCLRVVALSGGYKLDDAAEKLSQNHGMIASFSRALVEGLTAQMSDAEFNAKLADNIEKIYAASTVKKAKTAV